MADESPISEELLVNELKSIVYIAHKWQQAIEEGHLPGSSPNVDMNRPEWMPPNLEMAMILMRNELMLIGGKAGTLSEILHENIG